VVPSVSAEVVRSADATAPGDQDGCAARSFAAMPATCGEAIEVPEYASKSRPPAIGDTAATTSTPSATRSGFCRPVCT
jgi:hypothetical protein